MAVSAIAPISLAAAQSATPALARAFGECFARYGFAVVADHGIPPAVISEAFAATRRF